MNTIPCIDANYQWPYLVHRACHLRRVDGPAILGITGRDCRGTTHLATALATAVDQVMPGATVLAPMDGFHLSSDRLNALGINARTPEAIDAWGYMALIERIRYSHAPVVYAPSYSPRLQVPVATAIPIPDSVPLVITESTYLLRDQPPWNLITGLLDEIWSVDHGEHPPLVPSGHQQPGTDRALATSDHRIDLCVSLRR